MRRRLTHARRRCPFCGRPATHLVKWPWGSVEDLTGTTVDTRRYYCRDCAARVVHHQRVELRTDVRCYRYRRVA